ncbi:hypothetical protein BDZ45DRAFT_672628 [Acephala macrosclerotiorum]|nr:hypothetical protein BDZ45DRAFT_672628 [Acephala macrosclerotiorum]
MASADEILLAGVLKQIKVSGIDYKLLAQDIGAVSPNAARKRWERQYAKLRSPTGANGSSPAKPVGVQKVSKSPGKKMGGKGIKGKVEGEGSDEGIGSGSFGTEELEEMGEERVPVTPVRQGPGRKSRAKKFMEEDTEVEEDELVQEWDELDDSV